MDWYLVGKILVTFAFLAFSFVGTARDAVRLAPTEASQDRARLRIAARSSFMFIILIASVVATIAVIAQSNKLDWILLACLLVFYAGILLFVLARIFTISDNGDDSEGLLDRFTLTLAKKFGMNSGLFFVVGRMIAKSGAAVWAFYLLADFLTRMNAAT
ncbi:hypothetical protein G8E10_18150 [Rhizobiaceae bacterium CRRU44]|uniref:Uncharacterized protein n=1 Tax=Ferranicluibacter rubi TaxID=2715133 RepID=A0AA43ZIR1_9HYPH|nr:hypothetical protein [Ferranicluibacter rubi]NHT77632.1 hypothetical protein [Ferranicluibacter rubi]